MPLSSPEANYHKQSSISPVLYRPTAVNAMMTSKCTI